MMGGCPKTSAQDVTTRVRDSLCQTTILLYRGSDHGWITRDFYSISDKKGPTISPNSRKKDSDCIGGYT
jgi:hypothetical protein